MATFKINPGQMNERSVSAVSFQLSNDYWHFFNEQDVTVLVVTAKAVNVIERSES